MPDILNALGHALLEAGRIPEAIDCYEQTLRIKSGFAEARNHLARLRAMQQAAGQGS
jgi:tetratricopeptide (TPR) repeat protein